MEEAAKGAPDGQAGAWDVGGEAAHGVQLLGRGVRGACLARVIDVCSGGTYASHVLTGRVRIPSSMYTSRGEALHSCPGSASGACPYAAYISRRKERCKTCAAVAWNDEKECARMCPGVRVRPHLYARSRSDA